MLRVNVELYPYGIGEKKLLVAIDIINDGTGNKKEGNYVYTVKYLNKFDAWKSIRGTIKKHKRDSNVLTLLRKVMESVDLSDVM